MRRGYFLSLPTLINLSAGRSFLYRTPRTLHSIPWSESWPLAVCCPPSISAPGVSRPTRTATTALPLPSTLISRVPSVGMQVRWYDMLQIWDFVHSFADVLVHRQLSAAIGFAPLHNSLHSKLYVEGVMDVINRRHRLAQMAGRASVEFYVGLSLQARFKQLEKERPFNHPTSSIGVVEEAFVIRAFRNGISVFVHK